MEYPVVQLAITNRKTSYRFVQWYETSDKTAVRINKIAFILSFIRLQWQRTPGEENVISESKKYRLVPLECVWGMVQVVPKYRRFSTTELYEIQNRVETMRLDEDKNWGTEQFFVSRFYSSSRDEYPVPEIPASSYTCVVLAKWKTAKIFSVKLLHEICYF